MTVRKKKILVVDDSRDFLTYIAVLLKKMGFFKINLAESGEEAIGLMKIWTPDIMILDLNMPEMDGLATLQKVRGNEQTSKMPVIMVTASRELRREKECYRRGADQVISKPVTLGRLNHAIQECFALAGMNRRKNLRAPFSGQVLLSHNGKKVKLRAAMLSEGGIFLFTKTPLPVGEKPSMEFETAGLSHKLDGKVIYHASNSGTNAKGEGMALRFLKAKTATVKEIRGFVEGLIAGKKKSPRTSSRPGGGSWL